MKTPLQKLRLALDRLMRGAGLDSNLLPECGALEALCAAARQAGLHEVDVAQAQAVAMGMGFADSISDYPTSSEFLASVPIAFARRYKMLGLAPREVGDQRMVVALGDISCWEQLQVISRLLNRPVTPLLAPSSVVLAAINDAYQQRTGQAQEFIKTLERDEVLDVLQQLSGREDLLDNAARAPVIKLVNLVLFEAVKSNASDLHVQPHEDRLVVRLRIDGVLYDAYTLPKNIQDEVISRIKVMGRMNIAEKRLAQDGRATAQIGDRSIDLRIATLPTSYGERVVIRLLDKSARLYDMSELGMGAQTLTAFERLIGVEHGLILVTGPTGSGKSTTLYSALMRINGKEKNILTLEDPIEYQLEGISQTQVSDKKGMTFASGLRRVLRQDPDIIMVGEIRDLETATMAIQSSLTGHLVFSTLHTNDAASAVTRLLDLGIEPYLVASSLVGVLAQRLVRKVCDRCAVTYRPQPSELEWLGVERSATVRMRQGSGCAACRNTGYSGRLGTFELLALNDDVRRLVQARASAAEIKEVAMHAGTRTLRDDGIHKILAGATTISEVERVTLRSDEQQSGVIALPVPDGSDELTASP
ncbi:MAG TPA: ATPase, T2SS/T4P/T4SS family [Tepidisphaeraceae bacterium]|jgi:general secretion pathway protein E